MPLQIACALVIVVPAVALGVALPARAQQTEATLGLTSGLVIRGVALGHGGPALQATGTYYDPSGAFAGAELSTLGAPWTRAQTVQWQVRAGYARRWSDDWGAQVAYAYYAYPFDPPARHYEHDELSATLAWRDIAYLSVAHGAFKRLAYYEYGRTGTAVDLVLRQHLPGGFTAGAGIGRQQVRGRWPFDYTYGHLGIGLSVGALGLDLSRIVTNRQAKAAYDGAAADRWAAAVRWNF